MKLKKSTLAIATLIENPTWTDEQVAKYIGVMTSALYPMKAYQWAREIMFRRDSGVKTVRNNRTGELDMYEEPDEIEE